MAIINLHSPVSSRLLQPLIAALSGAASTRHCNALEDFNWLTLGVHRCLQSHPSGRAFLQAFSSEQPEHCPLMTTFFESLRSSRRLKLVTSISQQVLAQGNNTLPDRLAAFGSLDGYAVFATDAHFHEHACHDQRTLEGKAMSVGHI